MAKDFLRDLQGWRENGRGHTLNISTAFLRHLGYDEAERQLRARTEDPAYVYLAPEKVQTSQAIAAKFYILFGSTLLGGILTLELFTKSPFAAVLFFLGWFGATGWLIGQIIARIRRARRAERILTTRALWLDLSYLERFLERLREEGVDVTLKDPTSPKVIEDFVCRYLPEIFIPEHVYGRRTKISRYLEHLARREAQLANTSTQWVADHFKQKAREGAERLREVIAALEEDCEILEDFRREVLAYGEKLRATRPTRDLLAEGRHLIATADDAIATANQTAQSQEEALALLLTDIRTHIIEREIALKGDLADSLPITSRSD